MSELTQAQLDALLRAAERAHGAYERTQLGGRRDEDWPAWYAGFMIKQLRGHDRARELIRTLGLEPHPEGGHYGELFRSAVEVHVAGRDQSRRALTSIYFLLATGEQSRWHRVMADEAWHFYEGDPLELLWLNASGTDCTRRRLGPVAPGQSPVHVVPAGCWQAARPTGDFALVGCSVGPGFEFSDFALLADQAAEAAALRRHFPDLADLL